jgi:hypothetical protein
MLRSDDLPDIATDLLLTGVDSQSFACLAGSPPCDSPADRRELFEAGLKECSHMIPSRLDAAHHLKTHFAREVAEGKLDAARGAAMLVELYYAVYELLPASEQCAGDAFGIANVLGLYYSLDDLPADEMQYREVELEIVRECRRVAESGLA